ncbi:uncharacterized protein LOC101235790 isoform X3 [Hydra vulgaris]|uniref:Uncharacterized protein LOC101235790 isoform X3 n=1 Tax=Hydra vulgaris TaxID=6087 RepID=A0ABM4BNZ0_HYDVU
MKKKRVSLHCILFMYVLIKVGTTKNTNENKNERNEYEEAKLWIKSAHNKYISRLLTSSSIVFDLEGNPRRIIKYGSKWCGKHTETKDRSSVSQNMADLEYCCNQHYNCPQKVHFNQEHWKFKNTFGFTLNDCKCDDKFYECLKKIEGIEGYAALAVGREYFDILKSPCLLVPQNRFAMDQKLNIITKYSTSNLAILETSDDFYPGVSDVAKVKNSRRFDTN